MKLSVAILTHNEENNIAACLESVYDWVDEIVVVDGESTDKTVDIIKKFETPLRLKATLGAGKIKIFREHNPPNFLINKQKAIERCTKDWILQLDADETVSPELKDEILYSIENDKKVAYWLPRLNFFLGKPLRKGGQYPDYVLRLYKNGVAKIPLKTIHDQVEIADDKSKVDHLKNPLLHYTYPTFDTYLRKWMQYAAFEGEEMYKKGVRPSWKNHLLYFIIYPKWWFLKTFFRHKGFMDGFAGFTFALFSAIRYWVSYVKLFELSHKK